MNTAIIFDIQRNSFVDGPGIRTTVFFKGCNLKCKWCHNPESQSSKPQIMFYKDKCTGCGRCSGITEKNTEFVCFNDAKQICGREYSVEEVFGIIQKDKLFYDTSNGGVTFSGGEASLHFELLKKLLTACREKGYHTALETNGLISAAHLKELIPLTDLFLFDFKHSDPDALKKWAGAPLAPILESLAALEDAHAHVWLRCPVIPGVNDTDAHFEAICALKHQYTCIEKAEIMAYHDIGKTKWDALGIPYSLAALKTVSPEQKHIWETKIAD